MPNKYKGIEIRPIMAKDLLVYLEKADTKEKIKNKLQEFWGKTIRDYDEEYQRFVMERNQSIGSVMVNGGVVSMVSSFATIPTWPSSRHSP